MNGVRGSGDALSSFDKEGKRAKSQLRAGPWDWM
jgi:hypothetical protein